MTSIQHHVITQSHTSSNQLDNHLDALLDDLQTSVSRAGTSIALSGGQNGLMLNGSAFGGQVNLPPGATGYREVTTTVTRERDGVPTTSRDYQIEYLNPANTVTVLDERSPSPAVDLSKSGDLPGHQLKSYKTKVYDYKYSKTTSDRKTTGYGTPQHGASEETRAITTESLPYYPPEPQQHSESSQFSRSENFKGETTNVSKNLNELDLLLKELNNAPTGEAKREHVQTIEVEKSPERYKDLSSTVPKRSASATSYSERIETRSNRTQSPAVTPKSSGRTVTVQREYNTVENRSHTSRRDSPSTPTLRRRTPSPSSGEFRPSNFSSYPISPKDLTPTRTVTSKTYNYSSMGRRTPTPTAFGDEPQPYRSPSPVSFPQRRSPSPVRKNLNRSDSGRSVSYQVSPQLSENPTVITYKYSSHSREQNRYPGGGFDDRDHDETIMRPFPTSTPIPVGEQSPPKKLDELMASFQDSKSKGGNYQGSNEYRHHVEYARESQEKHGGDLQRSPSFERNLRPSNVKVTQTYSTQQQQQQCQEYQNQYQHREHYQQQRERPNSYHREYQTREQHPVQYQQQQNQYQQREQYQQQQQQPNQYQQREQYQQQQNQYQQQQQNQYQQREQYQQSQYQQYHQNEGGYQREQREQYQQSRCQSQQHQQTPISESMGSSQAYRATSSSRSVAGPPVYYPPGVELFTKKEEAMLMQEQNSGKDKSKGRSKSEKGKDKGKKMTGVPVCLPVCCAAPCSIM